MITGIDHIVLTVRDLERAVAFYTRVLDMQAVSFAGGRRALLAGGQKINLQTIGQETRNHACIGSGDVCLLTSLPPDQVVARVTEQGVAILEGPVRKAGARGAITSVYFNDPDGNLVEVSSHADDAT
ncbi:VOC family protein [Rhodobacteraceae bacterium 2CG4]|uniref:VOC family protein n=1 Tax=Halovulum marinum TaxID=2662447 RepID=A0A6L5Z5H1_9RHOB|nr:VOC family protein [Halovulum marinum]MSU91677.1 VOC family protein [Halovulum marinum]